MNTSKPFLLVKPLQSTSSLQTSSPRVSNKTYHSYSPVLYKPIRMASKKSKICIQGTSINAFIVKLPDIKTKDTTYTHKTLDLIERFQKNRVKSEKKLIPSRCSISTTIKLNKFPDAYVKLPRRVVDLRITSHRSLGLQVYSREGQLDGFEDIEEFLSQDMEQHEW